ncbi:MAG: serine/threonine-protein kinase [Thermoanaerobaculales bacterium]|jgi:serine/threonine-protein kinase|nr:serine/threonine-protein kinase [Thermoanaerobaculales bacterium]
MNDGPLSRLEGLLGAALELPPGDRDGFLDRECAGDGALRRELDELLAVADDAASFFDDLAGEIADAASLELDNAAQPRVAIGPYRTIAAIGHGGMGAVYRAERVDGAFDQQVALKLLHLDMDTPELRARFLAERQLLAGLSHPAIAHLLDGGVTDEGRPYFVMELVEGVPITDYVRDRGLTVEGVLRLVLEVIAAVGYLHRNLVVHRDLKPGNILVDDEGRVKLLDFGIAKLLADRPGADGLTRTGQQLMTPEYAAPEQLAGRPVTTATDVHALGLVLYELLTGERPAGRGSGRELPPTPSSVIRSRGAGGPTPGGGRPAPQRIDRDLDAICMMALRPDPEARYPSAEQLGQDIERHLEGRPVRARRGSAGYRAGLFLRRHRGGVAVAGVVAALMVTGLVREATLRADAERARHAAELEAAKAVAVSEFLAELLSSVDPAKAQGETVAVADVLEQASERIASSTEITAQPEVEAAIRRTIGGTYVSLGRYPDARPHLERAAALLGWPGSTDEEATAAAAELGVLYHRLGLFDESETLLGQVLEVRVERHGEDHPASLTSLNHLADLYFSQGRLDDVEPLDRRVLEIRRRTLGADHPDTLRSINALAATLHNRGRYAEAAELFSEGLVVRRRTLGERHPDTLMLANNLAAAFLELGRYDEAEGLLREVVGGRLAVLGEAHDQTAMSIHNLGVTLAQLGRYEEAEAELRRAIAVREALPGSERSVLFSESYLADVLRARGRDEEAGALYLETLRRQREVCGVDDGDTLKTAGGLAELRVLEGDLEAAEALIGEILEPQVRARGEGHPDTLQTLTCLARIRNRQGRFDEALEVARRAVEAGTVALGADHPAVRQAADEAARARAGADAGGPGVTSAP